MFNHAPHLMSGFSCILFFFCFIRPIKHEAYSSTFMTKRLPRHRAIVDLIRNADLFLNEAHAYMKLLPRIGSVGPRCLFADTNDIIMENLRDRGYVVCERKNLLDLNHCEATITVF